MRLAAARPRRPIDRLRTARRDWTLSAGLTEAAKSFSHREGGTLFMALVAALKALLHRYLAQEDVRVATNVANRNRPGSESLMGRIANTVVLRTDLSGDPNARELLRRVRATTLGAFTHQNFPFEQLADIFARERGLEPAALAPVMLLLQNASLRPSMNSAHKLGLEEAYPDIEGNSRRAGGGLHLQAGSFWLADRRSLASRFSQGARTNGGTAGAADLGNQPVAAKRHAAEPQRPRTRIATPVVIACQFAALFPSTRIPRGSHVRRDRSVHRQGSQDAG
jgi:Condensation domain